MGIFQGSKNKDELALVFDIGSSFVGGALFIMGQSKVPKIIYSIREPIAIESKIDSERFLYLTIKTLNLVASKIAKAGVGAPGKIFCVLSSPWYVSQTRNIKIEKNTSFVFNEKFADALIQKEIGLFEEEHLKKYTTDGNKIRSIELKNVKTILNGYPTVSPLDQKAKKLEMTIFISMSPEQTLNLIEETIFNHYHRTGIKFSSLVMASFAVVRDMFIDKENFLLIDIGGEVTDIAMVKHDVLRESISFPLGRNFMIRGVSEALFCTMDEAESYIFLYKDGHAETKISKSIELVINKLKIDWLKKFQECLANLSNDISIPATIYFTVEKEFADFFAEIIKTEQFNQYTLTESKFQIILLDTKILHGLANFEEDIIRDPFLIIESIYINRFLN